MDSTVLSIVVSYIVLAFLLLIFNLRTSYHWLLKSLLIASVTLFYILTYNSFKEILGWPTKETLPDRFRLVSAQIYEPNVITNSEGSIYIWITDMNDKSGLGIPRSHELPYSKEVHEQVSKASINLKNGVPQMGELQVEEEKVGLITKVLEKKKTIATSTNLKFFDMPNQLLPEK
tara:strand:- start:4479 stop:5003 length:525 start_codon:yes stop_codon:yes gene_type:complete